MIIQKIRNILKPFGAWDIGWNNFKGKLQVKFLISSILSLVIAIIVFFIINALNWDSFEKYTNKEQINSLNRLKEIGITITNDLSNTSITNSMDYLNNFEISSEFSFLMMNYQGNILYSNELPLDELVNGEYLDLLSDGLSYHIPIIFREESVVIIVQMNNDKYQDMLALFAIPAFLISILLFFVLFYSLTKGSINEIGHIAYIVKRMKSGDRDATIDLKGEHELSQLGDNINEMAGAMFSQIDEIKSAELYKRELITGMSHDLKTPLTSIIGYLSLLKDRDKMHISPEDQDNYIDLSYRKSIQLKKLIESLFEYSKYSSNSVKLESSSFSMTTFINQMIASYTPQLTAQGICLQASLPPEELDFFGDPQLLSRALGNLMDNLLKYTEDDLNSSLILTYDDKNITIKLQNSASTLKTTDINHLFERMVRGDSSRKDLEGSGLGLPICREIIHLHSGTINGTLRDSMFEIEIVLPRTSL